MPRLGEAAHVGVGVVEVAEAGVDDEGGPPDALGGVDADRDVRSFSAPKTR